MQNTSTKSEQCEEKKRQVHEELFFVVCVFLSFRRTATHSHTHDDDNNSNNNSSTLVTLRSFYQGAHVGTSTAIHC